MWILKFGLLYAVYLGLVTAHYKVLSESPTLSLSNQKSTPIFSGEIYLAALNAMKKSVLARQTRLTTLMADFTGSDVVDIDPLQLDETPMTYSKTVLVLNSSIEMASQYCYLKNGILPTPTLASDFEMLKTLFKKASIAAQVMDLRLESSFLVHELTGAVFDPQPAFISGLQLGTSTEATNPKSIEAFNKEDATSVLIVGFKQDAWVTGFASAVERKQYASQLCLVPRRLDNLVINNNLKIKNQVSQLDSLAKEYILSLESFISLFTNSPVKKLLTTSVDSVKQISMPLWVENSRLLMSQFNALTLDTSSATKLTSLLLQMIELIDALNSEIELFKAGFFSLGNAVCRVETQLTCISPDTSKIWSHVKILPIPVNNYKLNFVDILYPRGQANMKGCLTYGAHTSLTVLSDNCCQHLSTKSPEALSACPTIYEYSSSEISLRNMLLSFLGTSKSIKSFCGTNLTNFFETDFPTLLSDCTLEFLGSQMYSILNSGNSHVTGTSITKLNSMLKENDLVLVSITAILALLLLITITCLCRACLVKCLPRGCVNLCRCLTFDGCRNCPKMADYSYQPPLDSSAPNDTTLKFEYSSSGSLKPIENFSTQTPKRAARSTMRAPTYRELLLMAAENA